MSLIDSYDESEEVVRADILTKGQKRLPKTAIVCFKKELIDFVKNKKEFQEYSEINVCGEDIKIWFFVNSWGAIFINQLDSKISLSLNHFT